MRNLAQTETGRGPLLTPTAAACLTFVPTGVVNVLTGPLLPTLSARWSLNDTQAGDLFTAQFLASTCGVVLSGILVPRFGYRAVMVLGLIFMAVGVSTLPLGSWLLGIASVACYGAGFGLTVPTSNLLVAEANPARQAAALNLLNFAWSVGAVACPFLVGYFQRSGRTSTFLYVLGPCILLMGLLLAGARLPRPVAAEVPAARDIRSLASMLRRPAAIALAMLFFVYVGTENAVGGWLASYAKRLLDSPAAGWATTPSYFYGALLAGRLFVPILLRRISELKTARLGVATALLGLTALLASHSMTSVQVSACVIGLGLSGVYPITIALLSQKFGAAATRLGSVMFALAGMGAATVPWVVGFASTQLSSLKLGLTVPLAGCAILLVIYLRNWTTEEAG
jgi:FHS family glucose/mannose:H+ symporter-like MFS transporter